VKSNEQTAARTYCLPAGVRVFRTGDEIRLRKGVWSHTEATLRLTGQEERLVHFLNRVYDELTHDRYVDPAALCSEIGAGEEELASYCQILESLRQRQFLHDTQEREVTQAIRAMLGGNLGGFEENAGTPRPVLFFADTAYARGAAANLAREMGLPLDIIDDEHLKMLATSDLTTRTDALEYMEVVTKLEKVFHPYTCVVGCVASPNLSLLRNLNRLLIRAGKPLILGLIDGPFLTALSTLATDTGCFECFEQRMLARLEDTKVYHEFVRATTDIAAARGAWISPQVHLLTATVIGEAYLYTTLGMMRLAGRVVSIYLLLLEIQVQDLLRVPYCPACGFISKAQMNEMYTSSKRLVTEMLEKIEVKG
jgi:thiazole/oxazole-forming peptide maturase SagC family component